MAKMLGFLMLMTLSCPPYLTTRNMVLGKLVYLLDHVFFCYHISTCYRHPDVVGNLEKSVFYSLRICVVAFAFQITFRAEMHANDVFSFFKNHFWHQHIKTIQNVQTILNFSKIFFFWILWERGFNCISKRFLRWLDQLKLKSSRALFWCVMV